MPKWPPMKLIREDQAHLPTSSDWKRSEDSVFRWRAALSGVLLVLMLNTWVYVNAGWWPRQCLLLVPIGLALTGWLLLTEWTK